MNEKQMQEMAVSILLDEYTQLDVAQLLKEYEEDEENGEVPNVSDALDEKCNEMIQRQFAKKKRKKIFVRISKVLSRVAMITLMLIGLCTVSVLSVKAWREPALRFVLETFDRRSSVSMEGEVSKESKTPEEIMERLSLCVPKEYSLVQKNTQDGHCQVRYINRAGGMINLTVMVDRHGAYFDTESTAGKQMQINGFDVVFVDKNGYRAMWLDEDRGLMFDLRASSIEETFFWDMVYSLMQ